MSRLRKTEPPGSEGAVLLPREPRQRRAFSVLGGPVEIGGEPDEARALGALLRVDPALARALTHGFHSYAGRMHPSIARRAVARWSAAGEAVVDPFCGSGTVLVEAMVAGRAATGVDASPLAVAIARTRTTPLGPEGRDKLVATAAQIADEAGERARKRRRPKMPAWSKAELGRFHPHVLLELLGLRELVLALPDDDLGRAVRLCFSSILVKVMKAGPEAPRDGLGKRIARGLPSRLLADRAVELARGLAALEGKTPPGTPPPVVREGDARALTGIGDRSVALVLSSPPYPGTYDYAAQHDVRFTWLDLPRRSFERRQLGARAGIGPGVEPRAWCEGRQRWLGEIARILRPGSHALLVVGDGIVGGQPEHTPDAVAAAAQPQGLEPVARASQQRELHDRRLQQVFGARSRQEHLLLLRRQ